MLPLTRLENWLAMIAGDSDADEAMQPRTREEKYLAKIAGVDITTPEPRTRKEHYLNEIAEHGGGGGGGGGGGAIPTATVKIKRNDGGIGTGVVAVPYLYGGGRWNAYILASEIGIDGYSELTVFVPEGGIYITAFNADGPVWTIVSGAAESTLAGIYITGDCELEINFKPLM